MNANTSNESRRILAIDANFSMGRFRVEKTVQAGRHRPINRKTLRRQGHNVGR